jgi:hypothetical protein
MTRNLYRFLTARGREGQRDGGRIWERGASVGAGREVLVVLAKKWHVGKRLARHAGAAGIRAFGNIFDEDDAGLPPLGNLAASLDKRQRHRRAFLSVLFAATDERRLLFCLDPARTDILADLARDACATRVLAVETAMDEPWLMGHAQRTGLVGGPPAPELATLLASELRRQLAAEIDAARAAGLPEFHRLREDAAPAARAGALGAFLGIPREAAQAIAADPELFR